MRNVRKNFNIFVDGRGYAGQTEEFNAPKLTLSTEDFKGGGMHQPVELTMGLEKLESDFSLLSVDADMMATFDVREGFNVQVTAREALESNDGSVIPLVHSMRGKVKEIDPGTSKPGEKATTKYALALSYYKCTHGARVVHEVDAINMVYIRDGVDLLAGIRTALGI